MQRILLSQILIAVAILVAFASPLSAQSRRLSKPDVVQTLGGVVTSDSPAASLVGCDVMRNGGNAVDAAVATAFAMAVTWPEAGNIGGGGFMMVAPSEGDVVCVDYREKAPLAANSKTFIKQKSRTDSRMVGVPGTVRGLALAHQKFGKLPWVDLVKPAVRLAREGFVVDAHLARSINYVLSSVKAKSNESHPEVLRIYGRPDGREWRAGDVLCLPDLADTLDRIANEGADEFYTGKTAKLLVEYMEKSGGLISAKDLAEYQAVIRPTIQTEFRGYQVFGAPPPSSGGITIAMALNILDELDLQPAEGDADWTVEQMHLIGETMRRTFRERAEHLGDGDFVEIPNHLTTKAFAKKLAATIPSNKALTSREIAGNIQLQEGPYESPETTHFSVVDSEGMAVSNTYTLESSWGAQVIAPGTGAVLNNEMGDFNWYPGYTNLQGRIGTQANLIEPGKRMLSSMSPTIVKKNGKVFMVTGTPGGRTIINSTLGILLQRIALGRSLERAVAATRFHHQWLPDQLRLENFGQDDEGVKTLVNGLQKLGHRVRASGSQGSVHSIEIDPGTGVRTGVSDFRRGGRVQVTR